ncbi:MAG: MmcB family DNA repair protein [Propylenella sp.]
MRIVRQLSLLEEDPPALPADGRQSERALAIRRGVCRRLRAEGLALIPEVTLRSGRRADLVALGDDGTITIVEIKSSIEDFRADGKWPDYLLHSDHFYFATGPDVPADIFPGEAGLIVADPYGAEILREAAYAKISAAMRREMLIRIARAGALRLHSLEDPDCETGPV